MDTMEITKLVGAICGSLLIFLLIHLAAGGIFDTASATVAYSVEAPEAAGAAPAGGAEEQVDVASLVASADVAKGETVFKKCAACHHTDNTNAVGPHLNGVVGRAVASVAGFSYSDAMKSHGGDWTPDNIYHFIAAPKKFVPGTKMSFAGLTKQDERADVIAYLETLK